MYNGFTISQQAERLAEIFDEYKLPKVNAGFFFDTDKDYCYINIDHLNRDEIFDLVYKLKYSQEFITANCKSMINVQMIVDAVLRKLQISLKKYSDDKLLYKE